MPALKQASYRNVNQPVDLAHEAENHRPPPKPERHEPPPWQQGWRWALRVMSLLWAPAELVRQVGPGLPPEPRHVWDPSAKADLRLPL
jgi:hypothetical protein